MANKYRVRGQLGVPTRGYTKFHILKRNEGGPGQVEKLRQLKAAGLQAEACPSPYVGHSGILVTGNKRELARAEKIVSGRHR